MVATQCCVTLVAIQVNKSLLTDLFPGGTTCEGTHKFSMKVVQTGEPIPNLVWRELRWVCCKYPPRVYPSWLAITAPPQVVKSLLFLHHIKTVCVLQQFLVCVTMLRYYLYIYSVSTKYVVFVLRAHSPIYNTIIYLPYTCNYVPAAIESHFLHTSQRRLKLLHLPKQILHYYWYWYCRLWRHFLFSFFCIPLVLASSPTKSRKHSQRTFAWLCACASGTLLGWIATLLTKLAK